MAKLIVRLLGPPEIERDGAVVTEPPPDHKSWAVLTYLGLTEHRVSRTRLAGLIFGDADDPLVALEATLAQLRDALGVRGLLEGDPLRLDLPSGTVIDALALTSAEADPALARGDLLQGVPGAGTVFDAWLLVERRRLAGICDGVLRDAALERLAAGFPLDGAALALRALELSPLDESVHELHVRCLARAGAANAARDHADACEALFQRELGRAPDPRVRRAADEPAAARQPTPGDRAAALGQLDAGRAAIGAGAVEPGVACLRQACEEARGVADAGLLAQTLFALGEALVHSVGGSDEEGAAMLHEALALAESTGDQDVVHKTCRELAFVEVHAGRGTSADRWLQRAGTLAVTDAERAGVLGVRGMALSDRAHYDEAMGLLRESIAIAHDCADARQEAWSRAILARALLLRRELPAAIEELDHSLALVDQEGWVAFHPFPEALRAEAALLDNDHGYAASLLDHAFSLGCRLGDPCWEALAARAQGLLHESVGDRAAALSCLRDATARAVRVADPYVWIHAYCLDALADVAIAEGTPDATAHVDELERVAARGDMRELVVRAALHRASLGDRAGVASARLLAEDIANPALHAEVAAALGRRPASAPYPYESGGDLADPATEEEMVLVGIERRTAVG